LERLGAFGAQGIDGSIQLNVQDMAIEENQSIESLVLSSGRDLAILGQVRKKSFNLSNTDFCRMAFVVEDGIALCPMDIRFFGGMRIVFETDGIVPLVKKYFGFG
jgi:hypothetical protein